MLFFLKMQSIKRSAKAQNIVQILIFKEHMLRKKI